MSSFDGSDENETGGEVRKPQVSEHVSGDNVGQHERAWADENHPTIRPARRRSLPQEIVDQLLELIASGGFPDQQLPPERVLCEKLEVSRPSLREALSALTHLGIVETRGKSKFGKIAQARAQLVGRLRAQSSERKLITDPLEARRMLEPEVAAQAAERAPTEVLDEIEHWLQLMENSAKEGKRVVEYDSAFHVSIARATGNHTLVQVIGALTDELRESRELSFVPPEGARLAIDGHHAILDALRAKDVVKARRAMRRHLDDVERLVRKSFAGGEAETRPVAPAVRPLSRQGNRPAPVPLSGGRRPRSRPANPKDVS